MNVLAEIISIGDELLAGYTINTNSAFIARQLRSIGIEVKWVTVISDKEEEIISALTVAHKRAHVIMTTGGLGPTPDDITKASVCKFFNTELEENPQALSDLYTLAEKRGYKKDMVQKNLAQALVPKSAHIITNKHGTAPGIIMEKEGHCFSFMPGVPKEMQAMVENYFLSFLKDTFHLPNIKTIVMRTTGIAESILHDKMKDVLQKFPQYSVAYLPKAIGVDLRFRKTFKKGQAEEDWLKFIAQIREKVETFIFTDDERNMEQVIVDILKSKNLTLAVAESFTGGLLQDWITNIAGCSEVFSGGVVTYSNESKISMIGVSSKTLLAFGAVSEEVALEMARGVQKKFNSACSISTTGVAGPSGGSEEKPVGTCYIAARFREREIVKKFRFTIDRDINKMRGAMAGLSLLQKLLTFY